MQQAQIVDQCEREDRTAHALGVLKPSDELILWLRGMRRRGLAQDEYEWALERVAEIRRHGVWLKDGQE